MSSLLSVVVFTSCVARVACWAAGISVTQSRSGVQFSSLPVSCCCCCCSCYGIYAYQSASLANTIINSHLNDLASQHAGRLPIHVVTISLLRQFYCAYKNDLHRILHVMYTDDRNNTPDTHHASGKLTVFSNKELFLSK